MYEELVYVVQGRGATTVSNSAGTKVTFEWGPGSVFGIPLNASYQHFNGSGSEPARYYAVTSAPLMMNLFHNQDFIFGTDADFLDRFGGESHDFSGGGKSYAGRIWETNFIPDVRAMKLQRWNERGAGGTNAMLELAESSMCGHISEFPVGTYKKAHRHRAGAHVIILSGQGFSMLWEENEPIRKVDWKPGSVVVPPERWFHQHFNAGPTPARYLALRWGSKKFPVFRDWGIDKSVKEGGDQIEYEDEDLGVRQTFEAELAANDVRSQMDGVLARAGA
jgi:oxalate decarboxylase/phosphoglucose isomerase-like protein (cupin superfamily)